MYEGSEGSYLVLYDPWLKRSVDDFAGWAFCIVDMTGAQINIDGGKSRTFSCIDSMRLLEESCG